MFFFGRQSGFVIVCSLIILNLENTLYLHFYFLRNVLNFKLMFINFICILGGERIFPQIKFDRKSNFIIQQISFIDALSILQLQVPVFMINRVICNCRLTTDKSVVQLLQATRRPKSVIGKCKFGIFKNFPFHSIQTKYN